MAKQLNVNLAVTANTEQAKQQLQRLQQTLSSLTTNSANLKIGLDQTQLQQASKQLLELQAHLKAATNVDTGALDFTKLNNSIRNSGKTLTQYGQQLLALGPQGKEAFAQLAQSVAQSEVPIRRLSGLLGQFGTVLKNTIRWQISSSLIHGFMGSIQQAYGYAQDLNKSLNNIQIVTGLSDNQMAKFAKTANTAAKALSTTTTKYTDAALIYYQQGIRNEKEITDRTNATIKMANVTGQTAETVSNQMTAIWNNFSDGSKNLEYYADVITALGAATASSSEEISQGLQKFAAVADTVGLSYENATAALATITATTRQSADTVGTGLRTLFSRLQGLSLGQTLEDGVNLTKYSKALATVGVNALDAQGQLRNMDDVLNDLGNKWQSLSKAQQVALAQTVGGVRQYTNLIALMDNFDFYQQNVDIAKNSEGTLQRQQAIYEKSWEASSKRVKAAAETIYSSLINDQFFIKLNDGFAGFLDILNNIITGLGGMKGLLLGIGGVMTNVFSGQIAQGMYNFGMGIRNLAQTPSRQRNERAAFINNAAGLMAGGTYDAKTNTVTNIPNDNGPFSLVGQYTAMLQHQATFSGNAQYMTAQQKQMAQMALDNETKAYQDYQQKRLIQQQNLAAQQNRASTLVNQVTLSDQPAFIEATKVVDTATALYNKKIDLINQTRESGTVDGLTQDDLISLFGVGFTPKDIKNWTPEDLTTALNDAQRQASDDFAASRQAFVITSGRMGITQDRAEAYVNGQQVLGQSNFDVSHSQRRAEQARKNAEETAGLSSKGLRATTGITNLAAGVMSGLAASTQWDQASKAWDQFKAGALSAKDAVAQVGAGVAGAGLSAITTFSSMTKAVQAFGVASTAAAGWIGAALTVITVLAPKVIAWFDKMNTTDAEIGEQLTAGVEQATASANEAKQAYDNLINGFNTHSSLLDTLNDLTEGTLEFKKALLEANDAATKLIQDYNIDSSGWYYDDKGAINFTAEAEKAMAEQYYKKQLQATAEKNVAGLISGLFERDQAIKGVVDAWTDYTSNEQKSWQTKAGQWYGKNQSAEGAFLAQAQYEYAHVQHPDVYDVNGVGYANHIVDSIGYWGDRYQKQDASISEILAFVEQNQDLMADFVDYVGEGTVDFATIKHVAQVWSAFPTTFEDVQSAFEAGKAEFTKNSPILRDENGNIVIDEKTGLPQFAIENVDWEKVLEDNDISVKDIGFDDVETLIRALKEEKAHPTLTETNEKKYDLTTTEGITKFLLDQSQIRTANVSDNKLALSSARMAMTGQALSATENFVTDILSQQTNQIADIKERNKILAGTSYDLTQQNVTEDDIAKVVPDVVKEIRKTEGYNAAEDKNEYVRNAVFQKQFTGALQKVFDDAYQEAFYDENTKLPTLNKALLDNWQNLTLTEFATTLGNVFNDEAVVASLVKQYAKPITDEFLVSAKKAGFDISEETFLENVANKASLSDWATASALPDQFTTLYGEKTGQLIAQKIYEPLLEGNTTMLKVFEQFQSTGSKITDLANIKAGKTSLGTSELASDVYDSILSEAGEKGLFEELYNSEDFAEGLKSLRKELKKTGKIGADSLVALADQSELLSNYLEVSGTNVQGLADALNLLETGQIDNISNALLRALSAAGTVNSNLAQTYAYIDNFKEERSVEDIGAFMKKRADVVKQGFTSGMLLDASVLQSMEALFGADMRAAYQQDIYNLTNDKNRTPEQISQEINKKYADQIAAMQSIQTRGNLSGMFEYYEQQRIKQGGTGTQMFSYNEKTGQVTAISQDELKANHWDSQDAFIQGLQDNYGMSETMARAMASEYAATNGNIAQLWRETAAKQGITALTATVDENGNELNNEILTGDQARAFYKQYKDVIDQMYGYNPETGEELFLEKIAKDAEETGKEFIDLGKDFDIATASFEELQKRYEAKKGEGSFKDYLGLPKDGGVVTDLDAVKQKLLDLGMTSAKANTEIDKLIDSGEIKLFESGSDTEKEFADFRAAHQEIKSITEAWEAFQQKKKEAAEKDEVAAKQQELITNAIKDAAQALAESGIDVKLNPIDDAIETYLTETEHSTTVTLNAKRGTGWDDISDNNGSDGECFVAGTPVLLADMSIKNIENIQVNDLVMTYNEKIQRFESQPVLQVFTHINNINRTYKIYLSNNTVLQLTPEHPLLSNTGWKSISGGILFNLPIAQLNVGDKLLGYDDNVIIIDIQYINDNINRTVYNLEIAHTHTYIVNNIIVHNDKASGYNNAGFAGGKHSNGQYEGMANVGELGPELWIHDGQPYLAGIHGRTKAYIHPNDQIYTATQTQKILKDNPSLQDIPGFSVGYNQVTWGSKSNANADNAKTSKWEPERYHLITRQIKDLQREYDRLNKIREKTFGADKLKALDQEIEATNELIKGQKRLIQEAEDYLKLDTERVIKLLAPGEFQVDANGNLANFEELQQKYRKKAEEDKDEDAQTIWKALMQYEETIDKVHDSQTELQELIYQLQDLALEQITIKVELELDISEDRFEYLDYLLDKIDDDAFQAAEAIALLGDETAETMKKINNITMGLQEILAQNGLTLEDIDNMSADELKGAGFTQDQIEQIQEWRSELLKANSALLEMRKTIIEKVINAFNDLNDKVQKSYDNFDKYNSILEKYKNITDLIGKNISTQSRNIINQLNNNMLNNAKNTIKAARKIYENAQLANAEAQAAYQIAVASGDAEAIRRWQEVINATSEKMQEANEQWLDAWQNTLEQAKAMFEQAMEDIQKNYNTTMSVTFGSLDYLQAAYDRQKEIDKQYIPDFDRLYELSKLSRNISAAIDDTDNIKGKQKLRELQKEINKLQANGVRLSEYDVKVLEKKFELEQARLALDDAHNAKSQVRLQRDANGNWGYVYTANEDEIAKAEQEYEDKLHEYQVLNAEYLEKLQDEALQVQQTWAETVGQIKSDLGSGLITEEEATARLEEINKWLEEQQNYFYEQSNHALDNQASLYNRTLETYQVANANIVDAWDETNLSLMTKIHDFQDYMTKWQEAVQTFLAESEAAIAQHSSNIDSIDELAGVFTHTFENHIDQVIVDISKMSDDTADNISNLSDIMAGEFASALMNAVNWELEYVDAMDKMITRNEQFVKSLNLMIEKLAGVNTETTQMLEPLETLSNIIEQSTTPAYYANSLQELTNLSTERVLALLDANTLAYSGGLGQLSNPMINGLSTTIDQNVTITASFPNATNHSEIEEAFTNLINKASQYANRKGL